MDFQVVEAVERRHFLFYAHSFQYLEHLVIKGKNNKSSETWLRGNARLRRREAHLLRLVYLHCHSIGSTIKIALG